MWDGNDWIHPEDFGKRQNESKMLHQFFVHALREEVEELDEYGDFRVMIKLNEIFRINENNSLDSALKKLESLLQDSELQLIPIIVNPPAFPGEEEWEFYETNIDPILNKTGWILQDEHMPIAHKDHWEVGKYVDSNDGPLDTFEGALTVWKPSSHEAKAVISKPDLIEKLYRKFSSKLEEVENEFLKLQADINVGIPGMKIGGSRSFNAIANSRFNKGPKD